MAEPTQYEFTHKEIAEALIKKQGIHEGIWGLHVRFGIQGANVGIDDGSLYPTAVVPILSIGLQKFEQENNISVDASVVNPKRATRKRSKS